MRIRSRGETRCEEEKEEAGGWTRFLLLALYHPSSTNQILPNEYRMEEEVVVVVERLRWDPKQEQ